MVSFSNDPFEYIAPTVCVSTLLAMPLGPLFLPRFWIVFLSCYFLTFLGTQINHLFQFYKTSNMIKKTLSKREVEEALLTQEKLVHAFVIPNYAEPEALIRDTISRIAIHKRAQTHYVIILAMEASEPNHRQKSENLKEYFKGSFLDFIITNHPDDLPGEARGKGSNISYAARKGSTDILAHHPDIDPHHLILTIADSDSHIPELYISQVEQEFHASEDPHYRIYAPPIFFGRNCFDVPAAVRVTDITWSSMIMANLNSSRGLAFPCSTYSVSWVLANRVGYWDTDADAVGEDMHMALKCMFRTEGRARTIPIFVPINLTNVETPGYVANLYARYVQAKRHYNGVADVAYTIRQALGLPTYCVDVNSGSHEKVNTMEKEMMKDDSRPWWWLEKIILVLKVLETHFIPVTSGWLMFFAVPIMQFVFYPPSGYGPYLSSSNNPVLTSSAFLMMWNILKFTTLLLPLPLFGTLAIYEDLHRYVDKTLFKKTKEETRTGKHFFDYVSMPMAAWMFMTLPSNIASCKRLFKARDAYVVAEKVFNEGRDSKLIV